MACTRIYYDPCRTKKELQQSTGPRKVYFKCAW